MIRAANPLLAGAALLALATAAQASPQGAVVVAKSAGGGATVSTAGNLTTIIQSGSRVVIDWRSFNIGAGESVVFSQPNAASIAFNRIGSATTINGALSANGGVWLFSPAGLVFGPNARVNVGHLVASTGVLADSDLSNATDGSSLNLSLAPSSSLAPNGEGPLTVQGGAQLATTAGSLVLQSPNLTQGGAVRSAGNVTYLTADSGRASFITSDAGTTVAVSPSAGAAGVMQSFAHPGSTVANGAVRITAQAPAAGRVTVINLDGLIEADGLIAMADGVVLGGGAATPVGGTGGGLQVAAASTSRIVSSGGVSVDGQDITLGQVQAAGAFRVHGYGAVTLAGATSAGGSADVRTDAQGALLRIAAPLAGGGDADLSSAGDLSAEANVSAGGLIDGAAGRDILVSAGAALQAPQGVFLNAGRDVAAAPTSLLLAGTDATHPTGPVEAVSGDGGNVSVGRAIGDDVYFFGVSANGRGGGVTTTGDITASDQLFIQSFGDGSSPTGVSLSGKLIAGTSIRVDAAGGGDLVVQPNASLSAPGITLFSLGNLRVGAGATVTGGGAPTDWTWPTAHWSDEQALELQAASFQLAGSNISTTGDLVVRFQGDARIGDFASGGTGLSNESFQALKAPHVALVGASGQDVTTGALTVDTTRLASLWIGADSLQTLRITGPMTLTGGGSVDLALGFLHDGGGSLETFSPRDVLITGSLGGGSGRFGTIEVGAQRDVLIGSADFVNAAQADVNFDAVLRSSAYVQPANKAEITADVLQFAAGRRVIQQNTGTAASGAGLVINTPTLATPLITTADPLGITGRPQRVDLFAAFVNANGTEQRGVLLARTPGLLDSGLDLSPNLRINACVFGSAAECLAPGSFSSPEVLLYPLLVLAGQFSSTTGRAPTSASVFVPRTSEADADRDAIASPAAGSGNGDLWVVPPSDREPERKP